MSVFVDTSALIAVLNVGDQYHESASTVWKKLLLQGERLSCSSYILVETFALLQHRFGLEAVRLFQNDVTPVLSIAWIDETVHNRAISSLLVAGRRNLSLVDCTSFEIMRELSIERVFTFDRHFAEQGFELIPDINHPNS